MLEQSHVLILHVNKKYFHTGIYMVLIIPLNYFYAPVLGANHHKRPTVYTFVHTFFEFINQTFIS